MIAGEVLPAEFYRRDSKVVARALLNKVLVHDGRAGRIVETEAYCGAIDAGSHAYRGKNRKNATMFEGPGMLYVYFTYGMHWCANAVCGEEDIALAVLIRALAPLEGLDAMRLGRGPQATRDRDLCSGPAKLTQALGLSGLHDGANLVTGDRGVTIVDDGVRPPRSPGNSTRIGVIEGGEHPWRWYIRGEPNVSRAPRT
ncbi:MAG: DNA-3-methyladenine glycosylase [Acidimicrobiaceae bacterium]|jgi:DNA-3-methyladenine glycosylase